MERENFKTIIKAYEDMYWDTIKKYYLALEKIEKLNEEIENQKEIIEATGAREYMCYNCVRHRELQATDRYDFYACPDKMCCCYVNPVEPTIREFFKSKM